MRKGYVISFLVLANLFWAGNYIFGKYVVAELSPLQMTFIRWLIAVAILFPLAHWIEKPNWRAVWKHWKMLFLLALLGILGYNMLLYEALRFTTSVNAALVNSINPALIAVFAIWLLKEKLSLMNGFGLLISLFGVLLVLTRGQLLQVFQIDYNRGDLLMIAAISVWTAYTLLNKRLAGLPTIACTAVSALLGLIAALPFFLASGFSYHLSTMAGAGILYIALFPSVCSFVFWNIATQHVGASRAGIFLNLLTVFTAVLSLLLGNPMTAAQVAGGLLVIVGVILTNTKKRRRVPAVSESAKRFISK